MVVAAGATCSALHCGHVHGGELAYSAQQRSNTSSEPRGMMEVVDISASFILSMGASRFQPIKIFSFAGQGGMDFGVP